jgi:hypothetical protein
MFSWQKAEGRRQKAESRKQKNLVIAGLQNEWQSYFFF